MFFFPPPSNQIWHAPSRYDRGRPIKIHPTRDTTGVDVIDHPSQATASKRHTDTSTDLAPVHTEPKERNLSGGTGIAYHDVAIGYFGDRYDAHDNNHIFTQHNFSSWRL